MRGAGRGLWDAGRGWEGMGRPPPPDTQTEFSASAASAVIPSDARDLLFGHDGAAGTHGQRTICR